MNCLKCTDDMPDRAARSAPAHEDNSTLSLPIISLATYMENPDSEDAKKECKKAAEALVKYSALAVKDPRVSEEDNSRFLNLIEDYFNQPEEVKLEDVRAEYSYQVGPTPGNTEIPKCGNDTGCLEMVAKMQEKDKPLDFNGKDPKWRFFWRIGERPETSKFKQLNAEPVCPKAFPQWSTEMNHWGSIMYQAVHLLAEMLAVGMDLPKDTFTALMKNGPHLLAPTGSDLEIYGKVGTVLAGFHYDLNFLTIHGKSRFPGLNIWARSGEKLLAKIPDGCLLVQAAKQMEYLTGGYIVAGYHEVVVVEGTMKAIEKQKSLGRPLWRISSTLFSHIASDNILQPLAHFANREGAKEKYPPIYTGHQVQQELGLINLFKEKTEE
ncbi:hypothetical protein HK099_004327 [Clydaea vesicula]|uniref:Non-haem dioxygenase N-terminal domain-containing protein n=1 Tax=Clydaea vesicula TaxID=447962 RepID=A0AAD5U9V3_9FUNG|nr:hypothetical protein HK099_004327 [Clydaea vesicula]KAJ3387062.1 hypothetical protein HDU92_002153 [Lobulomyces angularis]